jgi:glyoxylase I family protein
MTATKTGPAPGPRGFHHLAVQVRDLAVVEAFYRDVLGLSVLRRWPAAGGDGERAVWLDTGDGSFIALERVAASARDDGGQNRRNHDRRDGAGAGPGPGPMTGGGGPGLHLVALRIAREERAAWERRLADAAVQVTHRTAFTLYVRDPEGNRVGLSHHPDPDPGTSG